MKKNNNSILYTAVEVSPFAKVGGLADVAGSLPRALRKLGADARIIMPLYRHIWQLPDYNIETLLDNMYVRVRNAYFKFSVHRTDAGGVPVYFIDIPYFFNRDDVYMYYDDIERFSAFCRAVVDTLRSLDWQPDVVHCNDWHTSLVPALMRTILHDHPVINDISTVFSIHNVAYQGVAPQHYMDATGLPWSEFNHHSIEFFGNINFLKAGIYYSDKVSTVSPRYAKEILTPEYGHGLELMLQAHSDKLSGILNGLDMEFFNPETDKSIAMNYSSESIADKTANKEALMKEIGLAHGKKDVAAPLFGIVSRLADQKGFDILGESIDALMKLNIRLVVLGIGDSRYENMLRDAVKKHPGKIAARFVFDIPLAQRIYAGSDFFLMPSKYEPCGLGQMIAMRYGTVPVVRSTGGLADTVKQFYSKSEKGNGFVFKKYASRQLVNCVASAVEAYNNKKSFKKLAASIMQQDFSWDKSAKKYLELYSAAVSARHSDNRG